MIAIPAENARDVLALIAAVRDTENDADKRDVIRLVTEHGRGDLAVMVLGMAGILGRIVPQESLVETGLAVAGSEGPVIL